MLIVCYFVPLLKNESNSPSSPLALSSFPANLSAPSSSDGFTGGGTDGRGGEESSRRASPFTDKPSPLQRESEGEKTKDLLVPLF